MGALAGAKAPTAEVACKCLEALATLGPVFETAYAAWREQIVADNWDGVPRAAASGSALFQGFLSAVVAQGGAGKDRARTY